MVSHETHSSLMEMATFSGTIESGSELTSTI
jgi:hypothetical protein